jgi:predicted dehydrogenase
VKKIRYGIIGFGNIAYTRIAQEGFCLDSSRFEKMDSVEVIGATDLDKNRESFARELGIPWYDSADALIGEPLLDAVFITTNNLSHASLAEKAIEAGKHCIIEKPIATTVEDAEKLREAALKKNVSLMVDHMMTHNVLNKKAADMIQKQEFGAVNDICLHMEFSFGSSPEEAKSWRCNNPAELGGPLGDVGCHCMYMGEMLTGSPISELSCVYLPRTLNIAVENGAFIQCTFKNGLTGTIRVAFNQPRGGMESTLTNLGYEVYGTGGVLRGYGTLFQLSGHSDEPIKLRLELDTHQSVKMISVQKIDNIYNQVIKRHAQSIRENAPFDGSDAIHNLKLLEGCHESATNYGNQIKIS